MLMKAAESRVVEKVPAGGSLWRLRSLVAMGHSNLRMARALGVHKDVVNRLVAGDVEFVSDRRFRDVRYLWEAWWDKRPPERNRHERIAASKARHKAEARKWPTPVNLDEDYLDEVGYRPTAHWHPATGVGVADDYPLGVRQVAALWRFVSGAWTRNARQPSSLCRRSSTSWRSAGPTPAGAIRGRSAISCRRADSDYGPQKGVAAVRTPR